MKLDPSQLSAGQRYKLLVGCVTPRPIALVSSISADGRPNLAPFSFFNGISADPMAVMFSPFTKSDGSDKDTTTNVLPVAEGGRGEFVINLAVQDNVRRMAGCAEDLPYGESEFDFAGLTAVSSEVVAPPRVAESPVAFECRTLQVLRLAESVPLSGNLVIGEVVAVHIEDHLIDEGFRVDQGGLKTVGRMGGPTYCRTTAQFELGRGLAALQGPRPFDGSD